MGFRDRFKKVFGQDKKDDFKSKTDVFPDSDSGEDNLNQESPKSVNTDNDGNFRYLDELIHSGATEIVLDSDIILGDGEESYYENGIDLDVDLAIDGNGHFIDACGKARIFNCTANVAISNIFLKNGAAGEGGAIYNSGELRVVDSSFEANKAEYGGSICNENRLSIERSSFKQSDCGVIFNKNDANLMVVESLFVENSSLNGSLIFNSGEIKIAGSKFSDNQATEDLFYNEGMLSFIESVIEHNLSEDVIINNDSDSYLEILNSNIYENKSHKTAILNNGNSNIVRSQVHNTNSNGLCRDIINNGDLTLDGCKFESQQNICNDGRISVRHMDIEPHIYPPVKPPVPPIPENYDFDYLNRYVHENLTGEIILDMDVVLKNYERDFLSGGIELDVDGLVIDGNGRTIDADGFSRMFIVTGNNITLRNIKFQNGFIHRDFNKSQNYGAAIQVNPNASLKIENCSFTDNFSHNGGGAIFNQGKLYVCDCLFENNGCKLDGGAIVNKADLIISDVEFKGNTSRIGSAIYNRGNLLIKNHILLSDNSSVFYNPIYTFNPVDVSDLDLIYDDVISEYNEAEKMIEEALLQPLSESEEFSNQNSKISLEDLTDESDDDLQTSQKNMYSDFISNMDGEESADLNSSYNKWQYAYVFISSTFNDMHAERDYLVKEVFPELSEWCEERKIILKDIDLRWGVSKKDSLNNQTIEKCLRHIDKSRPFFICFLGQRRGWIPKFPGDINDTTKSRYPEIDSFEGKSATEMEIEHALLHPLHLFLKGKNKECPSSNSLFFFRDDSYLANLSDAQRKIYTNESEVGVELADRELANIKDKILKKQSTELEANKNRPDGEKIHIRVSKYSGRWDSEMLVPELSHLDNDEDKGGLTDFRCGNDSLKEVLLAQLKEEVANRFPENMHIQTQTDFEKNLDLEDNFCYLKSEGYIPRPKYMEKLKYYVNDDSDHRICVVTAKAGFGKTTLLSKFAKDLESKSTNIKLSKRFCGTSDFSMDTYRLWKSIIDEVGISDRKIYPHNLQELQDNISEILEDLASNEKCIIIIDAINQMPDGIFMFKWLDMLPDNLKIIVSIKDDSIYGKYVEIIKNLSFTRSFEIEGLTQDEKKELIGKYLEDYLKTLDSDQINLICEFEASDNALFLKILLSELRVFGSFVQLREKIQMFGDSPISAFKHVLDRLEADEMGGGDVTRLMFSLLASARSGLSEIEMIRIIKSQTGLDEKAIRDTIRLNLRQLRVFMKKTEGIHDFFYDTFKIAAGEKYGNYNGMLLDYFKGVADPNGNYSFSNSSENNIRGLNELPYHLNQSGDYDELSKVLSSFSFIKNKLQLSNIDNLISDYSFAENNEAIAAGDDSLMLIAEALKLSRPILAIGENKNQLPAQLWGRLCLEDTPVIKRLLDDLTVETEDLWFRSKTSCLYSPKKYNVKSISSWGRYDVNSIAVLPNKNIVWGDRAGDLSLYHFNEDFLEVGINTEFGADSNNDEIVKLILLEGFEILLAHSNGIIQKWNVDKKELIKTFNIAGAELTDICLSKSDGKIYASSSHGIYSIDLETGEVIKEGVGEKQYNHISFCELNDNVVVCDDYDVEGWDMDEIKKVYTLQSIFYDDYDAIDESSYYLDASIGFMELNGRFVYLINSRGFMRYFNTLKDWGGGEAIDMAFICGLKDDFAQAKVLEGENELVTVSNMGVLRVWADPVARNRKFELNIDLQTNIPYPTAIDYYNDGNVRWAIVGNEYGDIRIIDLNRKVTENNNIRHEESVISIQIDGRHMITASENGEIFIWDLDDEEFINKLFVDFRCNAASYDAGSSRLALVGVKDEKNGRHLHKMATCSLTDEIWQYGQENRELEFDDEVRSWDEIIDVAQNSGGAVFIRENMLVMEYETELDKAATVVGAVPDSEDAFVGFEDGSIVRYPDKLSFDEINDSAVNRIRIFNDKLIAGHVNGDIEIYDFGGNHLSTLKGHSDLVTDFCIYGNYLISVSRDNTLRLWDMASNELLLRQFTDVYATSINIKDDKIVMGFALGEVIFFSIENLIEKR